MAISQDPDIFYIFNESSGLTVPNLNTGVGDGAIYANEGAAGVPEYTWNQDTGLYEGYLDMQNDGGANMTYIKSDLAAEWVNTLVSESIAMRFQVQSWNGSDPNPGYLAASSMSFSPSGIISVLIDHPNSTGDFDLRVLMQNVANVGPTTIGVSVFEDLSFGTDYSLACSIDRSTATACVARFKLNSETEHNPANTDQSGWYIDTDGPNLCRPWNFDEYYGVEARLYYYCYWRDYAISSADLALCNSAPATTIPLWPSSGATITGIDLVSLTGSAQVSLSSLRWDWFDQADPNLFVAPTDQGTAESTDGSGTIDLVLPNSTLTTGQTGFLILKDAANNLIGGFRLSVD